MVDLVCNTCKRVLYEHMCAGAKYEETKKAHPVKESDDARELEVHVVARVCKENNNGRKQRPKLAEETASWESED